MEEIVQEKKHFALLIDSDNISPKYAEVIFSELSEYGLITYRRIYGNWAKGNGWDEKLMLEHSIMPVQQFSYTTRKNSTDMAMVIDAMDILYSGKVDGFCLVTSDSDFTRLAMRLREENMYVIGMGESKTPAALAKSCNKFIYLDLIADHNDEELLTDARDQEQNKKDETENVLHQKVEAGLKINVLKKKSDKNGVGKQDNIRLEKEEPLKGKDNEESVTKLEDIEKAINNMIHNSNDDSVELGIVGRRLAELFSDFDVRNYRYTKLSTFVSDGLKDLKLKYKEKQIYVVKDIPKKKTIQKEIEEFLEVNGGKVNNLSLIHEEIKKNHGNFAIGDYGFGRGKFSDFIKSMDNIAVVNNTVMLKTTILGKAEVEQEFAKILKSKEGKEQTISSVYNEFMKIYPNFNLADYNHSKLSSLLKSMDSFHIENNNISLK